MGETNIWNMDFIFFQHDPDGEPIVLVGCTCGRFYMGLGIVKNFD